MLNFDEPLNSELLSPSTKPITVKKRAVITAEPNNATFTASNKVHLEMEAKAATSAEIVPHIIQNQSESVTQAKQHTAHQIVSSLDPVSVGKRPSSDDVKIIGGRGYDLRQPIPFKYPEVRKRFLAARNNFWVPSDIAMGDDKLQWQTGKLTQDEMWLFKANISYLTASDNLVPDNLDNAILSQITANEMRQYLRWQMAEEANHIESYFFILESFGFDEKGQGQIFELYQQIPELIEKLNWNLAFTNNVVKCDAPDGSYEKNRALLEDLISYYIFEYLFFPCGFSQVFALARQGKLRNTAQQYQYIYRDENLHAINQRWLIRQIIMENPQLWDNAMQQRARAIINEAVHLEAGFAKATMPNGGIPGLSINSYMQYAKLLADNVCRMLDLPLLFNIREHPMPWLSEYEMQQEVNFFEGRVRDYRTGVSLDWD